MPRLIDLLQYGDNKALGIDSKLHGGALEIDEEDNYKEILMQDITKCTSAAVRYRDKILFGSCSENYLAVCDYPQ